MRTIEQKETRAMFRLQRLDETMLIQEVKDWISEDEHNYYLGFGDTGDALMLLACCWDDPKAKVVFFQSNGSLCREFFELFDVEVLLHPNIIFSPLSHKIYEVITSSPNFKSTAHMADNLNLSDWSNWQKYKNRMVTSVPWLDIIGKYESLFSTKKIVVVCPSGSSRDLARQRFITDYEYRKLCNNLLAKEYTIVTIDSPEHLALYSKVGNENAIRCTNNYIEFSDGKKQAIDLPTLLTIINAATFCISVDTWPVTYCNLVGIPVKCIRTRYHGSYATGKESADCIFLNREIWPKLELTTVEEACFC
jgi:hypothetical protein